MALARLTDPATSHEAAESLTTERLTETQNAILVLLGEHPLTDEEIKFRHFLGAQSGRWHFASDSGLRSRRKELVEKGLIVRGGLSVTKFGRTTIVWRLREQDN